MVDCISFVLIYASILCLSRFSEPGWNQGSVNGTEQIQVVHQMSWKIAVRYICWCWAGPYRFCDSQHALWRWFMWCGCSRLPENVACRVQKRSKFCLRHFVNFCHCITAHPTMSNFARPPQDLCPAGTASKTRITTEENQQVQRHCFKKCQATSTFQSLHDCESTWWIVMPEVKIRLQSSDLWQQPILHADAYTTHTSVRKQKALKWSKNRSDSHIAFLRLWQHM